VLACVVVTRRLSVFLGCTFVFTYSAWGTLVLLAHQKKGGDQPQRVRGAELSSASFRLVAGLMLAQSDRSHSAKTGIAQGTSAS
jgi:hypothetical protein